MDGYLHKKFKKQLSVQPQQNPEPQQPLTTELNINNVPSYEKHYVDENHHRHTTTTTTLDLSMKDVNINEHNNDNDQSDQSPEPYTNVSDIINNVRRVKLNFDLDRKWCSVSSGGDGGGSSESDLRNELESQSTDDISSTSTKSNEPIVIVEQRSSILQEQPKYYVANADAHDDINEESLPTVTTQNSITSTSGGGGTGGGTGKYICTYCNLACSKPSVLQKHIRAHTNERPYPCISCGFSFKTRSNLYKHCRSRSHNNRLKVKDSSTPAAEQQRATFEEEFNNTTTTMTITPDDMKSKPYKPRFHTTKTPLTDSENEENVHLLEVQQKPIEIKKPTPLNSIELSDVQEDEPLNLTKNRKRCMSEASSEPVAAQKSLIKELLLKNLYADGDTQCRYCKMIFQTVTELELHKMRNCKGRTLGPRYNRSSSVNVASILTQNKNAFDNIPQMQNTVFPLKSPGPFLGKTRLVEGDKAKSFSYDDGIQILSPLKDFTSLKPRVAVKTVKMFGGQVKISDSECPIYDDSTYQQSRITNNLMHEKRVVKNTLQSGGTVLQNQNQDKKTKWDMDKTDVSSSQMFSSIKNFSKNAAKLLAPNLEQLSVKIPSIRSPQAASALITPIIGKCPTNLTNPATPLTPTNGINPMNLLVNGKVVRYVPGIPGPIIADTLKPTIVIDNPSEVKSLPIKVETSSEGKFHAEQTQKMDETIMGRKFARPNSLSLKPSTLSLKQHHGLTPTMFNQILISPDTPRGAKKYNEHFLHGNYFSYLGLKSSTKPVYCTLNKTQPFYVPHFKKLSMYSEWRQQDNKADKLYVSNYDSRQRGHRYSIAGKKNSNGANDVVHSSYKFVTSEIHHTSPGGSRKELGNGAKSNSSSILGGYESNDDYTYVRGRGRGRYVCKQCGIRCNKPSMLKKHIRTHSNVRPFKCKNCNFSFKTKGNLTKHMKSKAHAKNGPASNNSSGSSQVGSPTSDSDTDDDDDSGMDDSSSDDSTRNQEHEAAYGLLTLSQKPTAVVRVSAASVASVGTDLLSPCESSFVNAEQLVHVTKTNYAKNKILNQDISSSFTTNELRIVVNGCRESSTFSSQHQNVQRPLTYPYNNCSDPSSPEMDRPNVTTTTEQPENLVVQQQIQQQQQSVIRLCGTQQEPNETHVRQYQNSVIQTPLRGISSSTSKTDQQQDIQEIQEHRKRKMSRNVSESDHESKVIKDVEMEDVEVMDLSIGQEKPKESVYYPSPSQGTSNGSSSGYSEVTYVTRTRNGFRKISGTDMTEIVPRPSDYDYSAMETLADIATKQEKLEKNSVAKNVATEFLKFATQMDPQRSADVKNFAAGTPATPTKKNDITAVKPEENKSCNICEKTFSKPSQLRLHMNIHYLERPYRCESCSISFRTKGHLQKHERSASHHNKLSSSPALSSSEPRPFKCVDCKIAFRIHGHLAKHLRSKLHILKLECLSKIPFGLYAELERSNSLLTEINTADSDQCLDSLKLLAKRICLNDPTKLSEINEDIIEGAIVENRGDLIVDAVTAAAMES